MVNILVGVSGSGKTTIGKLLSNSIQKPFFDADDYHSPKNILKMKNGKALTDADRRPWLKRLNQLISEWNNKKGAVLACSALKEKHRQIIADGNNVSFIFLEGNRQLISQRLEARKGHFFPTELLQSQFDALEIPTYGIRLGVNGSVEDVCEQITAALKVNSENINDIGILGLGIMGRNLALNFAGKGLSVSVYNRKEVNEERVVSDFISKYRKNGKLRGFTDLELFIASLTKPRKILIMLKAGQAIEDIMKKISPFLDEGDVVIDGGNSHYIDTEKRVKKMSKLGVSFIGCGISGGSYGALNGPSLMPGGEETGWLNVKYLLQSIAAKDSKGNLSCEWIGSGGSGHFVKMVHNGIEYSLMQIIAEAYDILVKIFHFSNYEIVTVLREWDTTELSSYLMKITYKILCLEELDGTPLIENVLDRVEQKGTGKDIAICALEHGVNVSTITEAVNARLISGMERSRAKIYKSKEASKMANNLNKDDTETILPMLIDCIYCSSLISIIQGLKLIKKVSKVNSWDIEITKVLSVWEQGSIIRSKILKDINRQLKKSSLDDILIQEINQSRTKNFVHVVSLATHNHVPLHVFSAALSYYQALSSATLPANLIQLQREYFGSHGFVKKNSGGKLSHLEEDVK